MDVVTVRSKHSELFNPNLKLLQCCIDISEFAEHGSLHDYLQMVKFKVDYEQRLKWAMQIAKGMYSMCTVRIILSYYFVTRVYW